MLRTLKTQCTVVLIVFLVLMFQSNMYSQEYTFQQLDNEWGTVSMEAEHYSDMILPGADYFEQVFEPDYFSGESGMMAVATGGAYGTGQDALNASPYLVYLIDFVYSDSVYLWVRGSHEGGGDDSFHASLDGLITDTSERIGYHGAPYGEWTWLGLNMDELKPALYVDSPGIHQLEIYIRENGCKHDKFVLTTSRDYDPTIIDGDFGPEETLAEGIDIGQSEKSIEPVDYQLNQNYPNPFNPATTISYNLPKTEHVILRIFDIAGKEITTLVDELKSNGQHKISWNGNNMNGAPVASGVYICNILAGDFTQSNKMLLVR